MEKLKQFEIRVQDFRNRIIQLKEQYENQCPGKVNQPHVEDKNAEIKEHVHTDD